MGSPIESARGLESPGNPGNKQQHVFCFGFSFSGILVTRRLGPPAGHFYQLFLVGRVPLLKTDYRKQKGRRNNRARLF